MSLILLRGKPYRRSAELAKLKSSKRGMLAPIASWAIKSLMWQRPLGLSSLLIASMLHFSLCCPGWVSCLQTHVLLLVLLQWAPVTT